MKILPGNELPESISLAKAQAAIGKKDPKLVKAIQEFEAIFVNYMLKSMRETIPKSELMEEEAPGKEIFMSMFDQEISRSIAFRQADSLVQAIYRQLTGESPGTPMTSRNAASIHAYSGQNTYERVNYYSPIIQEAAQKYNVDPNLIAAVMAQESAGNPGQVSSKGAGGLMQLMPETATELGVRNVFDPRENIFGGAKYLRMMLEEFNGEISLALAAYNAGPDAVKKYKGIPPFAETQNYVKRVAGFYEVFQKDESI